MNRVLRIISHLRFAGLILGLVFGVMLAARPAHGQTSPSVAPATSITPAPQARYTGAVAIFFGMHHEANTRDWAFLREFGGPAHPTLGCYRSDNVEVLRTHLKWMRRAGVDVIVYSLGEEFQIASGALLDPSKDVRLRMLVDELSKQAPGERKLQLAIFLSKYNSNPSAEEYKASMSWLRQNLANQEWYFKYQGKPLLITYLNGKNQVIDQVERENDYFSMRRMRGGRSDAWSYVEGYPQQVRKDCMSATPGFDNFYELIYLERSQHNNPTPDLEALRKKSSRADRDGGAYYRKQLEWAKQHNPEVIFVSGWNDWIYGNQIEPATEYGFTYIDLTAEVLGRSAETARYR